MVSGTKENRRTTHRLHGYYVASKVVPVANDGFKHVVGGTEVHWLEAAFLIDKESEWVQESLGKQGHLNRGFTSVR